MSALTDAQALLQAARDRGDTRTIHVAQRAVRRAMTDQLRREMEARAEERRERSGRPFWWSWRRR